MWTPVRDRTAVKGSTTWKFSATYLRAEAKKISAQITDARWAGGCSESGVTVFLALQEGIKNNSLKASTTKIEFIKIKEINNHCLPHAGSSLYFIKESTS